MKTLKTLFFSLITILLLQSCQTDSLQKFFVDSQNDDNFMSIDIPTSLLGISSDMNLSEEELITLKSVKKINMLMLEASQYNQEFYSTQKERLNTILK
jgi:hypothetical protein